MCRQAAKAAAHGRPKGKAFGGGKGRAILAQRQFKLSRQAQVIAAPMGAVAQRMFEQDQKRVGRQARGHHPRDVAQKTPRGGQGQRMACRVIGPNSPLAERGGDAPAQSAVGGDQGCGKAAFGAVAQDEGNGGGFFLRGFGLNKGDALHRARQIVQMLALCQPLICHRGRTKRQGQDSIARGIGRGFKMPRRHIGRGLSQSLDQSANAELGVIFGGKGIFHRRPHRAGHRGVKARQNQRALGQPGHGEHQPQSRAARSGGTGDDHRARGRLLGPARRQSIRRKALAGGGICGAVMGEKGRDDGQEGLRALPIISELIHRQGGNGIRADPFGLHFIHQIRQRGGQIKGGGFGGKTAIFFKQALNELPQHQQAAQARFWRGKIGKDRVLVQFRHKDKTGQQACALGGQRLGDAAAHAFRVQINGGLGQRFGRRVLHARQKALREKMGEIQARGQVKQAEPGLYHWEPLSKASAKGMLPGWPTSHHPPLWRKPKRRWPKIILSHSRFSEKMGCATSAKASVFKIWAPR